MPMLRAQAAQVVKLLDRKQFLDEHMKQSEGFRTRAGEVQDIVKQLSPVTTAYRVLRENGMTDLEPAGIAEVINSVGSLQSQFRDQPAMVLGASGLARVSGPVQRLVMQVGPQLRQAWRAYAEPKIPTVNDDVLTVLERLPALRESVQAIRRGLRELLGSLELLPTDEAFVPAFMRRAEEVRSAWDQFDEGHLPRGVLQFLKDAGSGGAALGELTPAVLTWLREHRLVGAFRIRSVASAGIT
jgi:hypothetical protein